jgi:hypothetical protein
LEILASWGLSARLSRGRCDFLIEFDMNTKNRQKMHVLIEFDMKNCDFHPIPRNHAETAIEILPKLPKCWTRSLKCQFHRVKPGKYKNVFFAKKYQKT